MTLRVRPAVSHVLESAALQVLPAAGVQRLPRACGQVLRDTMSCLMESDDDEAAARAVAAVRERLAALHPAVVDAVQLIMADVVAYLAALNDDGLPEAVQLEQRGQRLLA